MFPGTRYAVDRRERRSTEEWQRYVNGEGRLPKKLENLDEKPTRSADALKRSKGSMQSIPSSGLPRTNRSFPPRSAPKLLSPEEEMWKNFTVKGKSPSTYSSSYSSSVSGGSVKSGYHYNSHLSSNRCKEDPGDKYLRSKAVFEFDFSTKISKHKSETSEQTAKREQTNARQRERYARKRQQEQLEKLIGKGY